MSLRGHYCFSPEATTDQTGGCFGGKTALLATTWGLFYGAGVTPTVGVADGSKFGSGVA